MADWNNHKILQQTSSAGGNSYRMCGCRVTQVADLQVAMQIHSCVCPLDIVSDVKQKKNLFLK